MRPIIALLLTLILGGIALDEVVAKDNKIETIARKDKQLYLSLNIDNGSKLQLSDGSTYLISPADRIYSEYWITPFPVKVTKSKDPDFPSKITNMNTGTSVNGQEISGKALLQEEIEKQNKRRQAEAKQKQFEPTPQPTPSPPPSQEPDSERPKQQKAPKYKEPKSQPIHPPENRTQAEKKLSESEKNLESTEKKLQKPENMESDSQ